MSPSAPRLISRLLAALVLGTAAPAGAQLAARTDVIHGRVIGADSTAVQSATVAVLSGAPPARVTRTDAKGLYSITIENGPGTYTVAVNMLGFAPQRRTVTRQANDSMPTVDFKLSPVAAQLGAVRSTGERPRPGRTEGGSDFTPGSTASFIDISRGMSGDVTGDLTAALSTLPGITVTPSATGGLPTVTAFGQGADQNSTVLNGLGFGSTPPRDGFNLTVVSSTYDPGRGGFGGVQLSLRMTPGTNYLTQSMHASIDAPALQATTPVSERLGTLYNQEILSGVVSGPVVRDKAYYAFSYQFMHRGNPLASLTSENASSLLALRVNPDSVSRLLGALGPLGLPTRVAGVSGTRASVDGRFAARFDFSPNAPAPQPGVVFFNGVPSVADDYYLQAGGSWRTNDGALIGPTSLPSSGGQITHRDAWLQATAAKYLPLGFLNEATLGGSASSDATNPYLDVPSARVLLSSTLPDGTVGASSVQLGGASTPQQTTGVASAELRDQLSRYTWDRHHQMTLTTDATIDRFTIDQGAGLGAFSYNSLADFTAGVPSSFSRVLTGRRNSGAAFTGAVGVGDIYAPSTVFRTQFGVRLEGNHFYSQPAFNATVDSLFGLRTDHVPSTLAVMPMVGFNWQTFGKLSLPGFPQAFPRGSITGGVREYRGSISTRTIDGYARQTGLPDATQQLYCVGAAAPAPKWPSYTQSQAAIPTECADGTSGTPLAQTAPPVALFAPDYSLSRSWRPTLTVNYQVLQNFSVSFGGAYVVNLSQPGFYDVNFTPTARFGLSSEGGRPVYVAPTDIVPQTGTLAWTGSRVSPLFAHVAESRSDLRSELTTLNASVSFRPSFLQANTRLFWFTTLSYAHTAGREQSYGFGGTTDGDPTLRSWSARADAEHVVTASLTVSRQRWFSASLSARAQSGNRFTPIVFGDVNGDGYATNDRAFVFNPAATPDTSISGPMQRLLSGASPNVRSCLRRQLGQVAGRNTCVGPWSFPLLTASFAPDAYRVGLGNRGSVSVLFTNVLGGLDQLLHGSSHLQGWGQYAYADPTLLTVRGYDPTANRFIYTVNPQFGNTSVYRSSFRAPFVMTLDFRMEVGPDRETQFVEGALRPRANENPESMTLQEIKARISPRAFNPLDQVLARRDSLGLTPAQVDTLTKLSQRYALTRDSIVTELARYLVARHGAFEGEEVRQHWHTSAIAIYTRARALGAASQGVFTPGQLEKLKASPGLGTFITTTFAPGEIEKLLRGPILVLP
ncbi:MAG: carboxypeptidase-like regulatory domain-containing protein [Gemmatimonadales bacterium]